MRFALLAFAALIAASGAVAQPKPFSARPPQSSASSAKLTILQQRLSDVNAKIAALKAKKDSMSEMSQQDAFHLQQAMEQKSQLEQMISNVMKASSDSQQSAATDLKGS
jgi:hypothetical protein